MFGRRRREGQQDGPAPDVVEDQEPGAQDDAAAGPYDAADAPADGRPRLDLGSLRLPVPQGAQLQVEMDRTGPVRAVHLVVPQGQVTVTAFAAPRSAGLWTQVAGELAAQLRSDGAAVDLHTGEWGREVSAVTDQASLRFLGVDGPRWMLRGVAAGTEQQSEALVAVLRDVVRNTVVVRGAEPLPVRSALPLQLPEPLAEQLKQAAAQAPPQPPPGAARP